MTKIEFSRPTEYDRRKFEDTLSPSCLDRRIKITARDDGHTAELFVEQEIISKLGEDYIRSHVTMYYNKALCGWFMKLSQNDYYNDTERNPEKVIQVEFDGIEGGTAERYTRVSKQAVTILERYTFLVKHSPVGMCAERGARQTTETSQEQI